MLSEASCHPVGAPECPREAYAFMTVIGIDARTLTGASQLHNHVFLNLDDLQSSSPEARTIFSRMTTCRGGQAERLFKKRIDTSHAHV